jgi:hypothetical protein
LEQALGKGVTNPSAGAADQARPGRSDRTGSSRDQRSDADVVELVADGAEERPPSFRATKPTLKVAKLATRPTAGSRLVKNKWEKMSAEASPYRARS